MEFIGLPRLMSKPMLMNRKSSDKQAAQTPWLQGDDPCEPEQTPWLESDDPCEPSPTWGARLRDHAGRLTDERAWVSAALTGAPDQCFFRQAAGLTIDASRQAWDAPLRSDLTAWSIARGLDRFRRDQFAGHAVNATEARAARHSLLRAPDEVLMAHRLEEIAATRFDFLSEAERIRKDPDIRQLIHIGIGGSDLGPRLLIQALAHMPRQSAVPHQGEGVKVHFAGNGDLHELESVLGSLDPSEVQIVLCSKSFTTPETLVNAVRLKAWMESHVKGLFKARCIAITANTKAATDFGVSRCFGFPDWVGGRYSLWSPIGLSAAAAIGADAFKSLLHGAWAMDQHWLEADPLDNVPWQLGLLDVWNRNALHYRSRCVVPYDFRLSRFPAYLQQLEMESNGKGVDQQGRTLPYQSGAMVWGEPGTNAQHSFFQWLHQGTDATPVEFVLIAKPDHQDFDAHRQLLSNALAQSLALVKGKSFEEALSEQPKSANPSWTREQVAAHRVFPGGRPSTIISLDRLDARSLGALIALYEHRVAVAGFLWRINSFDQWGVELGKELAVDIESHMSLRRVHPDAQTERWIQCFASQAT